TITPWTGPLKLQLFHGLPIAPKTISDVKDVALVLANLDEVRVAAERWDELGSVRAVVAPFVPSGAVAAFASVGIAAFAVDEPPLASLRGRSWVARPAPSEWGARVRASCDEAQLDVEWLALGLGREWTHAGSARPRAASKPAKTR